MKLINVNEENFVRATPNRQKEAKMCRLCANDGIIQRFSDVFNRLLGTFPGKVSLEVEPVIIPPVPTALKDKLKEELSKLADEKIIAPVDQPMPWVNSLVVTTKRSGALRICVDPKHLNRALKRESYQMLILDEIIPELAQAKVFSTVDLRVLALRFGRRIQPIDNLWDTLWQVSLAETALWIICQSGNLSKKGQSGSGRPGRYPQHRR